MTREQVWKAVGDRLRRDFGRLLEVRDVRRVRRVAGDAWAVVVVLAAPSGDLRRAHVAVERRREPFRRDGHEPPVIASAEGVTTHSVFRQLLEIASDNVAIARALLRWQSDGKARF